MIMMYDTAKYMNLLSGYSSKVMPYMVNINNVIIFYGLEQKLYKYLAKVLNNSKTTTFTPQFLPYFELYAVN